VGKDRFVKEVLGVANGGEKAIAVEGVIGAEYQTGDEGRQYDQLFERMENFCVELEIIKNQIEQMRDEISNCMEKEDEPEVLGIGCF